VISKAAAAADKSNFDLGLSQRDIDKYSVGNALVSALDRKNGSHERDISEAIEAKLGRPPRGSYGLYIPTALRPQMAGLDTKTNSAGGFLTENRVMDLAEALISQMRVRKAGATVVSGLHFSAQFPGEDNTTAATFVGENPGSDVVAADQSFKAVVASPRTLQGTTTISRQLALQSAGSVDLERYVRLSLMRSHALAFDAAAIAGTGLANQPTGIINKTGIPTTAVGVNGGVPTYALVCDMAAAAANANAPDNIAWLSTPDIRKVLQKTFINGTGSAPVWDGDLVLGRPALVTKNVPSNLSKGTANGTLSAIICGVWSELLLCEFGVIEVLVDQFAQKKRGLLEVTSFSMVDCVLPRPACFNVCVDAALS